MTINPVNVVVYYHHSTNRHLSKYTEVSRLVGNCVEFMLMGRGRVLSGEV